MTSGKDSWISSLVKSTFFLVSAQVTLAARAFRWRCGFFSENRSLLPQETLAGWYTRPVVFLTEICAKRSTFAVFAFIGAAIYSGCFFESSQPKLIHSVGFAQNSVLLDSITSRGTVDSAVRLFLPVFDPALDPEAKSALQTYPSTKVVDHISQKIIQYTVTSQRFGTWSPELEFQWNLFQLRTGFFFPQWLPDTAGLGGTTQALYHEVGKYDRFTRYVDSSGAAAERQRILTTRAAAMGLRLQLDTTGDTILIRQAVVDGPAWREGVRTGMRILAVDDSSVVGDSALVRFTQWTRGDSGTRVKLITSSTSGRDTFSVVKEPVNFPSVMLDSLGGIPIISLFVFADSTLNHQTSLTEFQDALRATKKYPALVLDLRDNPGGSLFQAVEIADEFLEEGTLIINQQQRNYDMSKHVPLVWSTDVYASNGGYGEGRKVVILADSGTASASEILYVAIRDGLSAPTVGVHTYGKGIGQVVMTTPGSGLSLITHLKFLAPKGEDYHGKGLFPSLPDTGTGAQQLLTAVKVAQKMVAGKPLTKAGADTSTTLRRDAETYEANRRERLWQ